MNIAKLLENPLFQLERGERTPRATLDAFVAWAPDNLPTKYVRFVRQCNGARGDSPYASGHIDIWAIERARERNPDGSPEGLPGFFAFADDGKDQVFAFDLRQPDGAAVCSLPAAAPVAESAEILAQSFSEFLEHIVLMRGRL